MRDSLVIPGGLFLNNRGLFMPQPISQPGFRYVVAVLLIGIAGAIAFRMWAKRRQVLTGQQAPVGWVTLGLVVGLPLVVFLLAGMPLEFAYPEKGRFNIRGGIEILPEFVALLFGLVTYTAGFIAEVVRAGILAVSKGQSEASHALGLRNGPTLRLVVIPQAMRVIIPPLTSQYLVQVFTGTVLNQTGQAVEVVMITMGVYLTISLLTSLFMNWFNARMAIVER
jgi:general L-amino acid transport system permease protein